MDAVDNQALPAIDDRSSVAKEIRARVIVNALLQNATPTEACKIAGYSEKTARTEHTRILTRPIVRSVMAEALEAAGITASTLANVARDGLSSVKPVVCDKLISDYPDYNTRHKYLETCARLAGYDPGNSADVESSMSFEDRVAALISQPASASECALYPPGHDASSIVDIEPVSSMASVNATENSTDIIGDANSANCEDYNI